MKKGWIVIMVAIGMALAVVFTTPVGYFVAVATGVVSMLIPSRLLNPPAAFVVSFLIIFFALMTCILFLAKKHMRRKG